MSAPVTPRPIQQNAAQLQFIDDYSISEPVSSYRTMLAQVQSARDAGDVTAETLTKVKEMVFRENYFINQYPSDWNYPLVYDGQFIDDLDAHMNTYLPEDYGKFTQMFDVARGWVATQNGFISAASEAEEVYGDTFAGMDDLVTGGFSSISNDLSLFGIDLANANNVIYLKKLDEYGYPSRLLLNIIRLGKGYIGFEDKLIDAGITDQQIASFAKVSFNFTNEIEQKIYTAMTKVTGSQLTQILFVLECTTTGITNLAELLDIKKLFPLSYTSIKSPSSNGFEFIFVNNGLNTAFNRLNIELGAITTPELSSSNTAFAAALGTIKDIDKKIIKRVGEAVSQMQINTGLSDVENLTNPLDSQAANSFKDQALGSSTGGRYVVGDVLGSVAGYPYNTYWKTIIDTIRIWSNDGVTDNLWNTSDGYGIFKIMDNVVSGSYGPASGPVNMPAGPWESTYDNWDDAIQDLTLEAEQIGRDIGAEVYLNTPELQENIKRAWDTIVNAFRVEQHVLTLLPVSVSQVPAGSEIIMYNFVNSLGQVGTDLQTGGAKDIISAVANTSLPGGQNLQAAVRESENQAALSAAGLKSDTRLGTSGLTPLQLNTASYLTNGLP